MAKENIFVTLYRKIFVGHGQGSLFASANPGSGPSEKSSPWRPSQTFTPPSTKKVIDCNKAKRFSIPTPIPSANQKGSNHNIDRKKKHTQKSNIDCLHSLLPICQYRSKFSDLGGVQVTICPLYNVHCPLYIVHCTLYIQDLQIQVECHLS